MKNVLVVTGNLGSDAKVKEFENGRSVIYFSVAETNYFTDKDGERQSRTLWHEVKKFGKNPSPKMVEMLKSGTKVTVTGSLNYNEYETENAKYKNAFLDAAEIDITSK